MRPSPIHGEPTRDIITLWTNDPVLSRWAAHSGVDRIGLDLETLGKAVRQRGLDSWISPHRLADLAKIRPTLSDAAFFVRCNPLNAGSAEEVETLLAGGVEVLMLPNFTAPAEVATFLKIVDGRARVVPLVERIAALACLPELRDMGLDELHVGLNDLSIELGLANRLVVLATSELRTFADHARGLGMRFGLGGLGRALDASLPVPSDLVYAQHARLRASGALLARSFLRNDGQEAVFANDIANLRRRLEFWRSQPEPALEAARRELMEYRDVPT